MTITRAQIEQRVEAIRASVRHLEDQLNAAAGALQDCEYWLELIERAEPPAPDREVPAAPAGGETP